MTSDVEQALLEHDSTVRVTRLPFGGLPSVGASTFIGMLLVLGLTMMTTGSVVKSKIINRDALSFALELPDAKATCEPEPQYLANMIALAIDILFVWPLGVALRARVDFIKNYRFAFKSKALWTYPSFVGLMSYMAMVEPLDSCVPAYKAIPFGTILGLALQLVSLMLPKRIAANDFAVGEPVIFTGPQQTINGTMTLVANHKGLVTGPKTIFLPGEDPAVPQGVDVLFEGLSDAISVNFGQLKKDTR